MTKLTQHHIDWRFDDLDREMKYLFNRLTREMEYRFDGLAREVTNGVSRVEGDIEAQRGEMRALQKMQSRS